MRSKNALKNVLSSLLLQGVNIVCGFIVPRLIIETYGSATNGVINSITQFLAYITLLESGFGPVVKSLLYKPIAKNDQVTILRILKTAEKFFRRIAIIFVLYLAVLCFVFPIITEGEFDDVTTIALLIIIALGTFAEYFFGITYKIYLQSRQKAYIPYFLQIVAVIISTTLSVILIKVGQNIQVVKLVAALVFVLRPLIQNWYIKKKYKINLTGIKADYVIKQKWDGLAQHIAAVIHSNTDVAVLTLLSTLDEVSVYSVYMLVVKGVKNLVEALNAGIDSIFGDMLAKNEHEHLNKRFSAYEFLFHTLSTIVFVCTMILITPFVSIYVKGVSDADYIRPLFGMLIALSEFIWSVRLPYSAIVLAAGHFKQTRRGAIVEAVINIVLSVILVFNFGIVGVAIGTAVAMTARTIEFICYSSKSILKRSVVKPFGWIAVILIESVICVVVSKLFVPDTVGSVIEWAKYAGATFISVSVVVLVINIIVFRSSLGDVKDIFKKIKIKEEK